MKKLISVILCVVLCAGMLSVSAPALAQKAEDAQKTTLIVEFEGESALEALSGGLPLQKALNPINNGRKKSVQAIESVAKGAQVTYTYTHVLNGVAIEATKGDAARIEKLDGVRAVYDVGGVRAQVESAPSGSLITSGSMIGLEKLHEMGLDGTGTAIAVIDGGLQWDHEAMTLSDPASAHITKSDVASVLKANTMNCTASADDLYKSAKVPFAFDYCDGDTQVEDDNNAEPDHGTHVSGIAAGNSEKLVGVAPEAQILIFKIDVYDDEVFLANLLAAIDDAAKFDIASMNMSVGMDFEMRSDPAHALLVKAIENARNSGISVCTAAGNSGVSTESASRPDNGTNGMPNSAADATSVASIDNVNMSQPISYMVRAIEYGAGKQVEVTGYTSMAFPAKGEYVPVTRKGPASSSAGKILLFYDVNVNLRPYLKQTDAAGFILGESVLDEFLYDLFEAEELPEFLVVSDEDGYRLMHSTDKTYSLVFEQYYVEPADILRASNFTSYGVSEDLELTVDVAAPGGIIYSSVTGGQYDIYSGTSMASPHIAGSAALLEQNLRKTNPDVKGREKADLKESLLCSTADPVLSGDVPLSPRAVGAGLVNLPEAVSAKAVLLGESERTAINLGDKIDDTFKLTFTVKNVCDEDVRYDTLNLDVFTDDYTTERYFDELTGTYSTESRITGQSVPLRYSIVQSDMPRSITLHAGESKTVNCTLKLDADQLEANAEVFTSGFYVEGYVYLTDSMSGNTPLNIPFMGFRGDWSAVPALEYGDNYEFYWGMMFSYGCGYTVLRNLKSLEFTLLDGNGAPCAVHTEEYVKKDMFYNEADLIALFDEEEIADGAYTLVVTATPDVPNAEQQVYQDDVQILIDRHAPVILDVQTKRTADGFDLIVTCASDDLDYFTVSGASVLDLKFFDLYPVDGYDHVDGDGNYVYVLHENEALHRKPVVIATDKSGLSGEPFGRYSLLLRIYRFFELIPDRILDWFLDWLMESDYLYYLL